MHNDAGLEALRSLLYNDVRFTDANASKALVHQATGEVTPKLLKAMLEAAGIPSDGPGAPKVLPWEDLRAFVKLLHALNKVVKDHALKILRVVISMDHTFLVVEAGRHFPTNINKTGVFDPVKESKKVMTVLPEIWTAMIKKLPADCQKVLYDFKAGQELTAADKAAKAAKAKATKDAKQAAQLALGGGAAGGGAAGGLAHWGLLSLGGGTDDGEASGRGTKRKAALAATQQLALVHDDLAEAEPRPKPKSKPKPAPKTDAALLAENGRLTARVGALELEIATLRAKLYQAGIEP